MLSIIVEPKDNLRFWKIFIYVSFFLFVGFFVFKAIESVFLRSHEPPKELKEPDTLRNL
ncbi:MAG: hypothetical protein RMI35_08330 [Leptospiraceae bacterium]|nr:hypothetical protein [Leptospiraceae bacterium]